MQPLLPNQALNGSLYIKDKYVLEAAKSSNHPMARVLNETQILIWKFTKIWITYSELKITNPAYSVTIHRLQKYYLLLQKKVSFNPYPGQLHFTSFEFVTSTDKFQFRAEGSFTNITKELSDIASDITLCLQIVEMLFLLNNKIILNDFAKKAKFLNIQLSKNS